MLGFINCVTVCAPDLAAIEDAYSRFLRYRKCGGGKISRDLAVAWGAAGMEGAAYLLMSPEASDDFVFRFVERKIDPAYRPLTTFGWNSAELIVRNVDRIAEQLADSPFEIVGPPKDLSFTDDIRAMQVRGPGNEIIYLTELKKPVPGLDIPLARCEVDRTFIVILGGPSITALQDFYHERFGVPRATVVESRITVASKAFGLPPEHRYPIAALPLQDQCLIEVDELPAQAIERGNEAGLLPPGIAIVSFACSELPAGLRPIARLRELPYRGRIAGICSGAAGELIELVSGG